MPNESEILHIQVPSDTPDGTKGRENHSESVEDLRKEVALGFLYSHSRANDNTERALEVASFSYALIELLAEKGLLTIEELDERKKAVHKRLVKKFSKEGIGTVALQGPEQDKYAFEKPVKIDCENRVHLCKAACCRLDFPLSKQDIEEGVIKWDLSRPYMIAKHEDGYCRHIDRKSCHCTVYKHRPIPCRAYDCRTDERIWSDFEQRIVNPKLEEIFQKRHTSTAEEAGT